MPLEDLDLEFEDEDEQKKKRTEAVAVDVDLAFSATGVHTLPTSLSAVGKAESSAPKAVAAMAEAPRAPGAGGAPVRKLDEARAQAGRRPSAPPSSPAVQGANAMQLAPSAEADFSHLVQELEDTKFDARVQVAVAEHKTELLADVLSDMKLLDHQVHQWLVRINQKHPDLKNEVLAVKKLLADFAAKKRK
jgi:hypothetical protein